MPFPRLTKSKPAIEKDDRPLLYAQQSSSTPSLAPSAATTTTTAKSEGYRDPEQLFTSDDTQPAEEHLKVEAEDSNFTRPTTPPQGSKYNPWSSYRDLPPDHPVFRYPDELREKMYAKGVDPVVKAEMDLARLGRVYGDKHRGKTLWKRGTSMLGAFGTMGTGGSF